MLLHLLCDWRWRRMFLVDRCVMEAGVVVANDECAAAL